MKAALVVGACILTSVVAWRVRRFNREQALNGWRRLAAYAFACSLAFACAAVVWPLGEQLRVMGFPFPVVFLQRSSTGVWQDFLGVATGPFLCLNVAIGGILGYGVVAWAAQRRQAHESAG